MKDFDEIYKAYGAAVYRLCLRAVSRPEVAEELTSEVFLAFHKDRAQIPEEQLPAWLFTVARRRAADYWRRHYVEQRWADSQGGEEPVCATPEFSLEDLLHRCTALKPIHRVCLILRFRHDMSRAEIARYTRLSELQVKSHLQYGLQLLRRYVDPNLSVARPTGASNEGGRVSIHQANPPEGGWS